MWDGVQSQKSNNLYSLLPHLPSLTLPPSLKWVILVMVLTGHGLDFDLCSWETQIKDSIYYCFMAAGMMNGAVSRSNQASVSLPHILIAKVASHRSVLLPSPCLPTSSFLCPLSLTLSHSRSIMYLYPFKMSGQHNFPLKFKYAAKPREKMTITHSLSRCLSSEV